jgi:transposase-like protein
MGRRSFTAEFKHEAVKLVPERGMAVGQSVADLGLHESVLRKRGKDAPHSPNFWLLSYLAIPTWRSLHAHRST